MKRIVILALAALALSAPLAAQSIDTSTEYFRGLNSYNAFDFGSFDSVNEDNGNLIVDIPIISYPQRGALPNFALKIHYVAWSWYMTCSIVNNIQICRWLPGAAGGVGYRGAYLTYDPHLNVGNRYCGSNVCGPICSHGCRNYYVIDRNAGVHNLGVISGSSFYESIDGSGLKYNPLSVRGVTDKNGIFVDYSSGSIKDPAGNAVTFDLNTQIWTDSVGRTIPNSYLPSNSQGLLPGCTTKNFPVVNGGTAPITICASNITCNSQFVPDSFQATNYSATLAMITSVTLPNNTSWTFSYNSWCDLSQITTPTGGSVAYTWNNRYLYSNSPESYYRGIATRVADAHDGTGGKIWTYSATLNGTVYAGVTDPDGNMMVIPSQDCGVYGSNQCAATRRQFYASNGALLKTVDSQYSSVENPLDFYDPTSSNQYMLPTTTTTTWLNGPASKTALSYDPGGIFVDTYNGNAQYPFPYGGVVQKQEYDYGPSAPGPLLRQTNTLFQWQNSSSFLTANLLSQPATVTVYDSINNQCKGQANPCAQTTYAYDETGNGSVCTTLPCGNLTSVTRWLNTGTSPKTQYVYNSNGMRTKMFDPLNNQTLYTYDSTGLFLSQIQYPNTGSTTHIENFSHDLNTGLLNWHKDQNLQQTSFGYDSMRRIKSVTYPDGGSETYCYKDKTADSCPPTTVVPSFVFTRAINSGTNFVETGIVDGFGRPKQAKTTVPASTCSLGYSYVDTTYDNEGRKFSVSNPYCTTSDATYGLTKTYYDALNRPCLVVPPDGTLPSGTACPATSPTNDIFTTYSGGCTTVMDQASKSRKSCTDGLGRMTGVWEDPSGLNYETDYQYDALDNLISVTQSGSRPRSFVYDSLSRLTTSTNPESNTQPVTPFTIVPTTYSYDGNGNVLTKTEPAPNQTGTATLTLTYCYDPLNRLTAKAYTLQTCTNGTLPSPVATYLYDQSSYNGLTITYGVGRRTGMTDPAGSEAWSYDKMGRAAIDQRTTSSVTKTTTYSTPSVPYNLDGSIAQLIYASGRTITYTPNNAAQPVSAVDTANNVNYATMALYAPQGALRSLTNGAGILSTLYYNNRLQPCRIAVNSSGTAPGTCADSNTGNVMDFTYDFHLGVSDNGNVYKVTNNRTTANDRNINYTYDSLNRIWQAYTDGNLWGETYSIDNWGNMYGIGTYAGKPAGETLSQGVNTANQLTNACSSNCYDTAGNLLNDGLHSYIYDAEGHTSTGAGVTYYYDGDGKRVRKSTGTLYWYGMNSDALDETDAGGNLTNEYIFFGGKRIARRDASSNVFYYFADHLGTSRAILQAGQTTPCYDQDFYPFGREVPHSMEVPAFVNTCPQNYKFTGKERDSESGLDNFGARYNSSQYGRFMTPDPIFITKQVLMDPQQLNKYAYVRNNPLRFVDPTGKAAELTGDDEERKRKLAALQKAVGQKAGSYLYDNLYKGKHYVGIYTNGPDGKGPAFNSINAVANKLGGIINDTRIATIQFVDPGTTILNSTIGSGPALTPGTSTVTSTSARIYLTSGDVGSTPGELLENGENTPSNLSIVLMHELGHVDAGWYHGGPVLGQFGNPTNSNGDAVRIENQVREMQGLPLRNGENGPNDVPLANMPY